MEKINLHDLNITETIKSSSSNLKEFEIFCSNFREIVKGLENLRKKINILNNNLEFTIEIFYFQKLSKERITIQLYINENRYCIIYQLVALSKENKKQQKKELPGVLIDEIIENFQPLKDLKFCSDVLIFAGSYTMKHLVNDSKNMINLELNNFIFPVNVIRNKEKESSSLNTLSIFQSFNENHLHVKNFVNLTRINTLILNFKINEENSGQNFMKSFNFLIDSVISNKNIKNVSLTIYHEDFIGFDFSLEDILKLENMQTQSIQELSEIKIKFINTNLKSKTQILNPDFYLIPMLIMFKYLPEFIEINFIELLNSVIDGKEISIYKFSKLIYSKRFYCILNSLKNKFKSGVCRLDYKKNKNILSKILQHLNMKESDIFEIKSQFLQLMIPKESNLKATKFLFNITQDYESLLERKIRYEDIMNMITSKPVEENMKKNIVTLKKYDLNTISKILSKIEGNTLIFLSDGRKISIAGKFKKTINKVEYSLGLNTIIEINKTYSRLKIFTYNDTYFLSQFHSAGTIFDNEYVIIVGGISIQELLPNFAMTPIFKINVKNFTVERILADRTQNKFYPGVIFNHKIKIYDKRFVEVSEGFHLAGYSGGLKMMESQSTQEKPTVEQNNSVFYYDLVKNKWEVKIDNSNNIK